MHAEGTGSVTVVLEAGLGDTGAVWRLRSRVFSAAARLPILDALARRPTVNP